MSPSTATRLALALLAVASCDVGASAPGEPVVVYLDGSEAIVLAPGDVREPLDLLAALGLAPEAVRYAEVRAHGETPIRVPEPLRRYPARILAAFPAAGGVGVGWVDRRLGELPAELAGQPPVSFAPATEVRLRTLDVERAAARAPKDPLVVAVDGFELEYGSAELDRLPPSGPRLQLGLAGGRQRLGGAPITSLVADAVARAGKGTLADVTAVVMRGVDGELVFTPEDLTEGATRAAALKRNRKGQWRLKLWVREGDRVAEQDGLRGVDAIEIAVR